MTLRILPGIRLRKRWLMPAIRSAIKDSNSESFRIIHYNVQRNHFHLVAEANGRSGLQSGVSGLTTRLARRLNDKLRRTGELFEERYHSNVLTSPTRVRNAIRYVLLNERHHAADRGETIDASWIDPYSSALEFDGWAETITQEHTFTWSEADKARVTVPPHGWLMREGWRRGGGPIRFDEIPGKQHPRSRKPRTPRVKGASRSNRTATVSTSDPETKRNSAAGSRRAV